MSNSKYFNFPIDFLAGFLVNHRSCLDDIADYHVYRHSVENYTMDDEFESFKSASNFYKIRFPDDGKGSFKNGKMLYDSISTNAVKVGMNLKIYWDYYQNDKTEFQKVCLLAFLGIKSILGTKRHCKTTNNFLLARMDGKSKSIKDVSELSTMMQKYSQPYWIDKIKIELRLEWHLKYYAKFMRGFCVSFKMNINDLVDVAERKKKSTKLKQLKAQQDEAIKRARKKLDD